MKVAFLTNIVSPYRRPALAALAAEPGWQLRVLVNAEREFDRSWSVDLDGLDVVRTPSFTWRRRVRNRWPVRFDQEVALHLPHGTWQDLDRFQPDVVISHELGPRTLLAALWAQARRRPLVVWSYQSRVSAGQGAGRLLLRRWLLRQAQAVVGMGRQAREVLRGWGVTEERIVDAPNAADTRTLARALADPACDLVAEEIRAGLGLDGSGRRLALVVGRLIPLKGVERLLGQWAQLPADVRDRWVLGFLGDGPLAAAVERAGPGVVHLGAVDSGAVAPYYQAADLLVFPTLGDVWGLVVNEAMQAGTPVLCSRHAGCADDLVLDGRTGLLYDPTEEREAVGALRAALERPDLEQLAAVGQRQVSSFTPQALADGWRAGVELALERAAGLALV